MACCDHDHTNSAPVVDRRYRRILVIALILNMAMFGVEVVAGSAASSNALLADSLDFLGDGANYAISLFVLGMALQIRARAALFKGLTMGLFGLWVLGKASYDLFNGTAPEAFTMGVVGALALATNVFVAFLLYRYRRGDSNMQSVWICSRNDAIGNIAVMVAAAGVAISGGAWPDIVVAYGMGLLAVTGAAQVIKQARSELKPQPA